MRHTVPKRRPWARHPGPGAWRELTALERHHGDRVSLLIDDIPPNGLASADVVSELQGLGRYAGPATLILTSLAEGPKHGYALTKDIERFAGLHLAPGTLYAALDRLVDGGLIEGLEAEGRRRPYRITGLGATALRSHLEAQRQVANTGLRRLALGGVLP